MHVDDAEARLRDLLCQAGVEGARESDWEHLRPATAADVAKAWEIFTRFAEEPVEGVDPGGGDVGASYGAVDAGLVGVAGRRQRRVPDDIGHESSGREDRRDLASPTWSTGTRHCA